jgi:hypothetical protein
VGGLLGSLPCSVAAHGSCERDDALVDLNADICFIDPRIPVEFSENLTLDLSVALTLNCLHDRTS